MKNITSNTAVFAAVAYADITLEDACNINVRHTDGLYEVTFESDWMRYDCYVDENDGEVLGFDLAPLAEPAVYNEQALATA